MMDEIAKKKKWENLNIIRCIIDELRMSEDKG
jgi:hypothetical protein